MNISIGIASYNRPILFKKSLTSALDTELIHRAIVACDADSREVLKQYENIISHIRDVYNVDITYSLYLGRRGSTSARNWILDKASEMLSFNDILVLIDDDHIITGVDSLKCLIEDFSDSEVGLVGGKIIDLTKRRIDPDFYVNLFPWLSETLTKLTGFIFLDVKHGPRYTYYLPPLLAIRVDLLKKGIRYDVNYKGTAYREESDLQEQVRALGYKLLFDPRFKAFHLALEYGGNRADNDIASRIYWKARNHTYFAKKNRYSSLKLCSSLAIIAIYAFMHGLKSMKAFKKGVVDGIKISQKFENENY